MSSISNPEMAELKETSDAPTSFFYCDACRNGALHGIEMRGGQAVAICQDCGLVVGGIVRRKRLTPKEALKEASDAER